MAQSGNRKQFLVEITGCAFKVLRKCSLKFLRFFFLVPPKAGQFEPAFFKSFEAEGRAQMGWRLNGRSRRPTFEI